jgi:phage/plasmid-associated DNA primase
MQGALDVLRQGTITVPESVATYSAHIVRPVRPVDRFVTLLEAGQYEVADDELYAAYIIYSKRQGLAISPRDEFLDDLCERLKRAGISYLRRFKATGYQAQRHVNDQQKSVALFPQLLEAKSTDLFMGFRIAEGPFGPAIGPVIPPDRRGIPVFVSESN